MFEQWETKRVLITVKTYPTPAWKGGEVVCTAGITDDGQWIRLFPIPFRLLDDPKQFMKYHWIEARVKRATSDPRPESYLVDVDSINVTGSVGADKGWRSRWDIVSPLVTQSMCALRAERDKNQFPTLGMFRPRVIDRLLITPTDADWSNAELERLAQLRLIDNNNQLRPLEKIPYTFYYEFSCDDESCSHRHKMSCTDWEMAESYRRWTRKYGVGWKEKFLEKYQTEMIEKNDTHFYVGDATRAPKQLDHHWALVSSKRCASYSPSDGTPSLASSWTGLVGR